MTKLDYSIKDPAKRKALVEQIIQEAEISGTPIAPSYLEILGTYLIGPKAANHSIISENHNVTINKREVSFEGLSDSFQNKDDIYNLVSDNPRGTIFRPKISITKRDVEEIPMLADLRKDIATWEKASKQATGKNAYLIKKALIEMRKDQYLLKQQWRHPISFTQLTHSTTPPLPLEDKSHIDEETHTFVPEGITLADPKVVSAILCNYSRLKQDSYGQFDSDLYWLLDEFDNIAEEALKPYPAFEFIATAKIDGLSNNEISKELEDSYNTKYSSGYISSLWRTKIPDLIALCALKKYTINTFRENNWPLKTCSRCGETKPASPLFFSHNSSSKDKFYSICKKCRSTGKNK